MIDNVEQMEYEEETKPNKHNKRKEREFGMEIDDEVNARQSNSKKKNKRKIKKGKRHSKSYYMMNY